MIIVADSTPLHYLIQIGQVDLLRQLYSEVLVPEAVFSELTRKASPDDVRGWLANAPTWVRLMPVSLEAIATVTDSLDPGERAAIALAQAIGADLLLIDEAAGRREASRLRIRVTGTLGVLRTAAEKGWLDVPDALRRLQATNFYVDESLIEKQFGKWLDR